MKPCFKLCTFDVTNTLLRFKMSVGEEYAKIGRIYGIEREPTKLNSAFRNQWKIMNLNYPNFGCSKGLTSHEWWRRVVQNTFSVDGNDLTTSYLIQIAKPDKRIFDLALYKSPGVKSSDALHIGDNLELDYQAAKNAGWNALLIHDEIKGENLPVNFNTKEVLQDITEVESYIFRS